MNTRTNETKAIVPVGRKFISGIEAKAFYSAHTQGFKYSGFGKELSGYGGYWKCKDSLWEAFDFTNGEEVFIEAFDNEEEAIKYACGIMANTVDGNTI